MQVLNKRPVDAPSYTSFKVANPVLGSQAMFWAMESQFHLGYNLHQVCNTCLSDVTSAVWLSQSNTVVQYWKSPYAKTGLLEIELHAQPSGSMLGGFVNVTLPAGAAWIGNSPFDSTVSSSLRQLTQPGTNQSQIGVVQAYVDVSNVSTSSAVDFALVFSRSIAIGTASYGNGFARVAFNEVPLAYSYVQESSSTEPGVDCFWTQPGQYVFDSAITSGSGMSRIFNTLDEARSKIRKTYQVATHEDGNRCWFGTSGSNLDLTYQLRASGAKRYSYLKTRDLYLTASVTSSLYTMRVHYRTNYAGTLGSPDTRFSISTRPMFTGSFTRTDLNLVPSTAWTTASASVYLPTVGANNVAEFYFTTTVGGAATNQLWVKSVALFESEP